jgi:glycosyltransferase involved in cell wall biosynthesis
VRILWVKAGKLLPVDTGGKIRSYNILRHLALAHEVTLLSYYGGKRDASYEAEIRQEFPGAHPLWTATLDGSALAQSMDYVRRVLNPAPFAVSKFTNSSAQRLISTWLAGGRFDVAICDFLSASLNFPSILKTPSILFQHNVETSLWQRMAWAEPNPVKKAAYRLEATKMARYERHALGKFHHILAVSAYDRRQMLAMDQGSSISVIATGVDTNKYPVAPPAMADPPRIVFTGSMDWEPNIDAVTYFCRDVFPRIIQEYPQAIFQIVGRNPHPKVKQLASPNVHVTGTVLSIADYLRDATVVIVPLRIGGGTRLKIFEAMAMGKALVSTSIGAEGLEVRSGSDLILADDAASFAESILLLIRDASLRRKYEQAAAKLAAQFDWSTIVRNFSEVLEQVRQKHTLVDEQQNQTFS